MSKEIEFRAWDKKTNNMYFVASIDMFGKVVTLLDDRGDTLDFIERAMHNVELMQFTGLLDKNGVEIYEGDVVEMTNPNYAVPAGPYWSVKQGDKRVVKRLESGFSLIRSWEFDTPNLEGNVANYDFWNYHRLFEVIGNIYENSSLLERK